MSHVEWILIRATGLSAVVLLSAAMVLGLMLSLRMRSDGWPAVITNDLHQYVTSLALWMTGAHLLLLILDVRAGISLVDLVVPFLANAQPIAIGVGTLSVLALAVGWWTSVNRARIGHATWRRLHFLSFAAYALAMAHGIFSGTDSGRVWAWPVYVVSLAVVGGLTMVRITGRTHTAAASRPLPTASAPTRTPEPRPHPQVAAQAAADGPGTGVVPLPPLPQRVVERRPRGPVRL